MRRVSRPLVAGATALIAISVTPASANFFDMLFGRPPPPVPSYAPPSYAPPGYAPDRYAPRHARPSRHSAPLQIKVRPKSAAKPDPKRLKPIIVRHKKELGKDSSHKVASRPGAPKVAGARPDPLAGRFELGVQQHMNPETTPDWHLKDLTLRRGDILVLRTGPVVFEGSGRVRTKEDFVSLKSSHLSPTGKREIDMMVSGVWAPDARKPEMPAKRRVRRAAH